MWPAFWMLGDDIATAGWPGCGEIDIMENIGKSRGKSTARFMGRAIPATERLARRTNLRVGTSATIFIFSRWNGGPNAIRFYVDGVLYETRTPADLPAGKSGLNDHPFFIFLNVAVGGGWPGNPDETTKFPQKMLVDYVRVYERAIE